MNNIELAYIAGFWDGEGSFMLSKPGRRYANELCFESIAQVCQAMNGRQEPLLQLLKEKYGGCYFVIKDPPSKNKNAKPVAMWRATNKKATDFAEAILPYLRSKKRQAEIIIRFGELRRVNHGRPGKNHTGTIESQREERLVLVSEIRKLNHRGKE